MGIKVIIQAPGLNLQAAVTDDALPELIMITQKYRDQDSTSSPGIVPSSGAVKELPPSGSGGSLSEEMLRTRLGTYGAAELLNQLQSDTYPEKILVLSAWHEARGGGTPWKSSDMDAVFRQAKEAPPGNFPRDIKAAIKAGWIHTHTPRTYSVTRTGWNRVAEAVSRLNN